jgi:hypothetical protein
MSYIYLRGPIGRLVILALAIGGFILAMGDVLDFYDAWWKITVPLTLVYAAAIWIFALGTPKGESKPEAVWPLGLDIILGKLLMTVGLLLVTLGVVALAWDLFLLVKHNWAMILVALGLMVVIVLFAMIPQRKSSRRPQADAKSAGVDDVNL